MDAPVQTSSFVVYLFGPSPEGKYYVGQTDNFQRRIRDHSKAGGGCPRFHEAIRRYGWDAIPVKFIAETHVQEEADRLEILYITKHNSLWPDGYNMTLGGRATRFDPDAKIVGFEETPVSEEEIFAEAKKRLANNAEGICPACGRESYSSPCSSCGVAGGFGRAALAHFVSGNEIEAFMLPGVGKSAQDFRLCCDSNYYIDLLKSRSGRERKLADIIPLAAIQYAGRLLPYMRASLKRAVLVKRKEPSFTLGRFIAYPGRKTDVRLEISINRHLRRHRRELGVNSAQSIEVFRSAIVAYRGRDGRAQPLVEQILQRLGATQVEVDEAARDAALIQRLNAIGNLEMRGLSPEAVGSTTVYSDERGVGFEISMPREPSKVFETTLFAYDLTHFAASGDQPEFLLMHKAVTPGHILVISFDTHTIRRNFISELADKSSEERIVSLQQTTQRGSQGLCVRLAPFNPASTPTGPSGSTPVDVEEGD
jgi:predicted GIY-YIG superfamily endonuclease